MVTLNDSLVSSSARMLHVRMRPDLIALQQRYQGQIYWVVKEPVGLHYFRFQEEEFAILQMLDGQTSLDEIKIEFENRFPPQKITVEELGHFVGMLHRQRTGDRERARPGRTAAQAPRPKRSAASSVVGFSNMLALRFQGIDPDRIFNWLYPKIAWFYSAARAVVCLLLALSGPDAGDGAVRHVSVQAAHVSPVLRSQELDLHGRHAGDHQSHSRVWARADLQAFWRRMSRDGRHVPGAHAVPVLQRLGLVDAAEQMAPRRGSARPACTWRS